MTEISPRKKLRLRRRLASVLSSSTAPGIAGAISIGSVEPRGPRQHRYVTVMGFRPGVFSPAELLARSLRSLLDPTQVTSPARTVDKTQVRATPPNAISLQRPRLMAWPTFFRRMRRIAGERWICQWSAPSIPMGRFFLFSNRVLLQGYSQQTGWINRTVPKEGLPLGTKGDAQ